MVNAKSYFDVPRQATFWDYDGSHYNGGIVYRDEIICGDCGGIFKIEDVCNFAPQGITPIVIADDWYDFGQDIIFR